MVAAVLAAASVCVRRQVVGAVGGGPGHIVNSEFIVLIVAKYSNALERMRSECVPLTYKVQKQHMGKLH